MKLKHRILVAAGLGTLLYVLLRGSSKENADKTISISQNDSDIEDINMEVGVTNSDEELELN